MICSFLSYKLCKLTISFTESFIFSHKAFIFFFVYLDFVKMIWLFLDGCANFLITFLGFLCKNDYL